MKTFQTQSAVKQTIVIRQGEDTVINLDEVASDDGFTYSSVFIEYSSMLSDEAVITKAKKYLKENKLASLIITTDSGNVFDANETARNNMLSAITVNSEESIIEWKMADNTTVPVAVSEIKEALTKSIQAVSEIIKS